MLNASRRVGLLDRYRVPYVVTIRSPSNLLSIGRADGTGPRLLSLRASPREEERFYCFEGAVLYVALAENPALNAGLQESGCNWEEEWPITDFAGERRASVYGARDGSVFLPFDIDAALESFLRESYLPQGGGGPVYALMRGTYYRARPLIPRSVQLKMRRRFRRYQERAMFPAWPAETSLHRLEALLLGLVERVAGEPLPWISPWPAPYDWAVVLTHDVEQKPGYENISAVRLVEERYDLRSAWYLVPERDYRVEESLLERLDGEGCEVGLHGLRHDGRDLSPRFFEARLPTMRSYAERWGVDGFRSPATHRDRDLIQQLGVKHDSSWCDVARYEPQPGGSCSWLPFFIGNVVELPITMAMDHTIFEVLGQTTDRVWQEKAELLRAYGGMALMVTHPDYLVDPGRLALYERFLARLASDRTAWHALPREVAEWWRTRSRALVERRDGVWKLEGSAGSRARLRLGAPEPPRATERSSA